MQGSRTPAGSRDLSPTCSHRKVGNITGSSAGKLRSHPTHQTLRCVGQHQSARLRALPSRTRRTRWRRSPISSPSGRSCVEGRCRRFGASEPSLRQIDCFGDSLRRRVCRGRHVVRRVILKACGHSITLGRQRVLVVVPARHPTMLTAPARQPRIELRLQWFIRETFRHKYSLRLALYCTTQSAGLQAPATSPAARLTNPSRRGLPRDSLPRRSTRRAVRGRAIQRPNRRGR